MNIKKIVLFIVCFMICTACSKSDEKPKKTANTQTVIPTESKIFQYTSENVHSIYLETGSTLHKKQYKVMEEDSLYQIIYSDHDTTNGEDKAFLITKNEYEQLLQIAKESEVIKWDKFQPSKTTYGGEAFKFVLNYGENQKIMARGNYAKGGTPSKYDRFYLNFIYAIEQLVDTYTIKNSNVENAWGDEDILKEDQPLIGYRNEKVSDLTIGEISGKDIILYKDGRAKIYFHIYGTNGTYNSEITKKLKDLEKECTQIISLPKDRRDKVVELALATNKEVAFEETSVCLNKGYNSTLYWFNEEGEPNLAFTTYSLLNNQYKDFITNMNDLIEQETKGLQNELNSKISNALYEEESMGQQFQTTELSQEILNVHKVCLEQQKEKEVTCYEVYSEEGNYTYNYFKVSEGEKTNQKVQLDKEEYEEVFRILQRYPTKNWNTKVIESSQSSKGKMTLTVQEEQNNYTVELEERDKVQQVFAKELVDYLDQVMRKQEQLGVYMGRKSDEEDNTEKKMIGNYMFYELGLEKVGDIQGREVTFYEDGTCRIQIRVPGKMTNSNLDKLLSGYEKEGDEVFQLNKKEQDEVQEVLNQIKKIETEKALKVLVKENQSTTIIAYDQGKIYKTYSYQSINKQEEQLRKHLDAIISNHEEKLRKQVKDKINERYGEVYRE